MVNETVSSKYYFLKKCFLDSYLENAMRSTMRWKAVNNEIMQWKKINKANVENLLSKYF